MRYLTLIRHAKSSWDNPLQRDFDRPLNPRGQADAPLMGAVLRDAAARFDLMVSSPAERAISTARIIAHEVHYPAEEIREEPRIYDATADALLNVIRGFEDSRQAVAMIGHNPGFSELANLLVRDSVGELPTGAALQMSFEVDSWTEVQPGGGRLIAFDYPKKHRR